jgi:hypothetical protein
MQKIFRCAFAAALVAAFASPAAAGEVKVTLNQGLVTIIADEAPISRILAEWARLGQTKIVNGEKMMTVVSLQLVDIPERQALDILLRSASGYMAAERQHPIAGASAFDRIMILPFSRPPAVAAVPASSSMPPAFTAGPRPMVPQPQDDDGQPVMPPGMSPQQNTPMPQQTSPRPGMMNNSIGTPNGPTNSYGTQPVTPPGQTQQPQTLPRPGFLPAPPGTPNQPVPFGTPPAPTKPPGGGGGGGQGYEPDRD